MSTDKTVEIAKRMECHVIGTEWKLLGSRYLGFRASKGKYIMNLDSDQFLEIDTVEKSISLFDKFDMLCIEEKSICPRTLLEKMFDADRRLVSSSFQLHTDPLNGVLIPRFFRRHILEAVFDSIPARFLPFVIAGDDAIIYFEAAKVSHNVGMVSNGMTHRESQSLKILWKKNFRYGKSMKLLLRDDHYIILRKKYHRLRKAERYSKDKLLSDILLLLKAPSYLIGLYF
jgi:hypothetical protein